MLAHWMLAHWLCCTVKSTLDDPINVKVLICQDFSARRYRNTRGARLLIFYFFYFFIFFGGKKVWGGRKKVPRSLHTWGNPGAHMGNPEVIVTDRWSLGASTRGGSSCQSSVRERICALRCDIQAWWWRHPPTGNTVTHVITHPQSGWRDTAMTS